MKNICRVDVLETSEDLIEKITNVIIAQPLRFEEFVEVCFHQALHNISEMWKKNDPNFFLQKKNNKLLKLSDFQ